MDQIEFPSKETWEKRREWFEQKFDVDAHGGSFILGEHATALLVDLQAIYCAGAFVSVVIISCAVIDAHLREIELPHNFCGGMKAAFTHSAFGVELDWLRQLRNSLVHWSARNHAALSVDDHYSNRAVHEKEAQRAICVVAAVLFENPWI